MTHLPVGAKYSFLITINPTLDLSEPLKNKVSGPLCYTGMKTWALIYFFNLAPVCCHFAFCVRSTSCCFSYYVFSEALMTTSDFIVENFNHLYTRLKTLFSKE